MKRLALLAAACTLAASAFAQDNSAMFAQMDQDGDGRVTAQEHALGVRKMFAAMDGNKDGRVTAAEMSNAQAQVGNRKADAMSSSDKIKAVDKNLDGLLTVTEHVAGARAMFAKMDKNKDGVLDKSEYAVAEAVLAKK